MNAMIPPIAEGRQATKSKAPSEIVKQVKQVKRTKEVKEVKSAKKARGKSNGKAVKKSNNN